MMEIERENDAGTPEPVRNDRPAGIFEKSATQMAAISWRLTENKFHIPDVSPRQRIAAVCHVPLVIEGADGVEAHGATSGQGELAAA